MRFFNKKRLKLVSQILCFLLVFQVCFFDFTTAFGATGTTVSYTINGTPQVGNTIEIVVNLSNVQNLYGASVDFLYDTSVLEVLSVEKGNILGSSTVLEPVKKIGSYETGTGQANIAFMLKGNAKGITANGTLAVIKAKVLKEGSLNLKTTSSNNSLSLSGSTCRIKLSDETSKAISYTSEDKTVNLAYEPYPDYNSYEDVSSFLNFVGNWSTASSSLYSGGSVKYTNSSSAYMEFNFVGSSLELYATKGRSRGIARIDIDNGSIVTDVDLYNSTDIANQLVYANQDLPYGSHSVRVYFTDSKNPNATNNIVDIDRIDIYGFGMDTTPRYNTYQNSSIFMKYVGDWSTVSHPVYSGGSIGLTSSPGAYVEFSFKGPELKLYATKGRSRGIARIDIDDGAIVTDVDLYNSSDLAAQLIYENKALSDGNHTVRIYYTDSKNANSTNPQIDIDKVEVLGYGIVPTINYTTYQDSSPEISYIGDWTTYSHSLYNGGSIKLTESPSAYLEFKFTGTAFKLYSTKGRSRGIAKIDIDNGAIVSNIDLYSSTDKANQLVYENNKLSQGTHTVRVYYTGNKNPNATKSWIDVDKIEVAGTAVTPTLEWKTYQDSTPYINYVGNWSTASHPIYNGGSIKLTNSTSSYMEFNFVGTAFKLYSTKGRSRGIAKIDIDNGKIVTNVDLYSATDTADQLVYENNNLSHDKHTVRVYFTNTKNPSATSNIVDVDRIDIAGTAVAPNLPTNTYQDSSSSIKYSGNWTTASHPIYNGGSIKYTSSTNAYLEFDFTGTAFKLFSTKGRSRGIAKIDIDNGAIVTNVDLYNSSDVADQLVYENKNLDFGTHKVKIYFTNTKNPSATNTIIDVDRIEVVGYTN